MLTDAEQLAREQAWARVQERAQEIYFAELDEHSGDFPRALRALALRLARMEAKIGG